MGATIYLLVLIVTFAAIVIWVFGRKRKARFEQDARIPLDDGKDRSPQRHSARRSARPRSSHDDCRRLISPPSRSNPAASI
jgi:cytochrome c oxidase cbb3-type subunit IV